MDGLSILEISLTVKSADAFFLADFGIAKKGEIEGVIRGERSEKQKSRRCFFSLDQEDQMR